MPSSVLPAPGVRPGAAWSGGKSHRDLVALDGGWQERCSCEEVEQRKAIHGARIEEGIEQAWRDNALGTVLKDLDHEAKACGLYDAPTKLAHPKPDGTREFGARSIEKPASFGSE